MSQGSVFFLIVLITVLTVRTALYIRPMSGPTLAGVRIHHYVYGLIAIGIGLLLDSLIVYGIGFGLFIDELAFLLLRGKTHEDNYSKLSLIGTAFFLLLTFLFRDYLLPL